MISKKYRYTLSKDRIEVLNKYKEIDKSSDNIIYDDKIKTAKILKEELLKYDLKEKFCVPTNFGNMNYKFSLFLSDFSKT